MAQSGGDALNSGHVIATPTDTIYGLAALVQNREAVQRLYEIKGILWSFYDLFYELHVTFEIDLYVKPYVLFYDISATIM